MSLLCHLALASLVATSLLPAASAQQSLLNGLGLEGGFGYSGLSYITEEEPGLVEDVSRTAPYFTPGVRLQYNRQLHNAVHVMPFFGYTAFGGRSAAGDIPDTFPDYEDRFRFRALEGGAFVLYEVAGVQLGAGLKVNRHLEVTQRAFNRSVGPGGPSEPFWITTDFDFLFDDWSVDGGLRVEYEVLPHMVVATEGWLGLSRLENELVAEVLNIRSRHVRIALAYRL